MSDIKMNHEIDFSLRPWHLANTTLRNPLRLRNALQALVDAGFEGRMGKEEEEAIARALDNAGIITLNPRTKDITSISRKWRSGLSKLGFITPDFTKLKEIRELDTKQILNELGKPYTVTENGQRLLSAQSLQAQQEVFLRSISALSLPSPLEHNYAFKPFSPLRHILEILRQLEKSGIEPYISRLEMASLVIFTHNTSDIEAICDEIMALRTRRERAVSKRKFDAETMESALERQRTLGASHSNYGTFYDYQDVSFRYLKMTGLFQSKGRGISLVPEKKTIAHAICDDSYDPLPGAVPYMQRLFSGAELPTDNIRGAVSVLEDLIKVAKARRLAFDKSNYDLDTVAGASAARYDLDALIFQNKELEFALEQPREIDEISAYLAMLDENKTTYQFGDYELKIPKEERAAYLEWTLWRVVLAFGDLAIPPNSVRRFHIDQDFLPIGTASGGGADIIAEYDDKVIVIEVTLTESSRQEAAEGEPVRRHVADMLAEHRTDGKDVLGLFIARNIDTNAAETFRVGTWYLSDNDKVRLDIAPLTLKQLRLVVDYAGRHKTLSPRVFFELIQSVMSSRDITSGAPGWKEEIESYVQSFYSPQRR
ncbi:AlwI family type II restriction endonuclease [Actinotignum sp. GS-2025a]|uniref:AlwI family type II restriction endonuclease n=1 Tax=Actinotignum sp. GS-2025a TaxID=3427274 RepID=UPI003F4778EB